ncbi:MAG: hypothetical protein QNJ17_02950 [Desulfocapsaceae bacterium]|nr:hypothetical protein [Desulfocapsaceae bacterium]
MDKTLLSVGLVLAWLVTPESIVLVTKGSGLGGLSFLGALVIGGLLAVANSAVIHNPRLANDGYGNDLLVMTGVFGKLVAMVGLLSGRLPILLFAATGMLVSAGFVFNEIFVYWFPNFLFAFLLLVLLAAMHLFANRHILLVQNLLLLLTIGGLLILSGLGVFTKPATIQSYSGINGGFSFILIAMACIPFLGFDFPRSADRRLISLSIAGGLLLLIVWSLLAMKLADPTRLTESSVAHRSIARAVAGEQGGYIIGLVVISGVLAGVNGLLHINRQIFTDLLQTGFLPTSFSRYEWLVIIVLAVIIGIMMMSGFAGDKILETQIRAAVILWFIYLGIRSLAAAHLGKFVSRFVKVLAYFPGCITLFLGSFLVVSNLQMTYITNFTLGVLAVSLAFSLLWNTVYGRHLPNNLLPRRKKL